MNIRFGAPDRRRMMRGFPHAGPRRSDLVGKLLAFYQESPGRGLRLDEAARLLELRTEICRAVLNDLVKARRLRLTADGHYVP
jgi:hypothetical protein